VVAPFVGRSSDPMPRISNISRPMTFLLLVLLLASPAWAETDPFDEIAPNAPKTGSEAPSFSAVAAFGDTINLKEELKGHNVLLLFYRGVF